MKSLIQNLARLSIYSLLEKERIKMASFPLNNHILRVSMEKQEQHRNIHGVNECFKFLSIERKIDRTKTNGLVEDMTSIGATK